MHEFQELSLSDLVSTEGGQSSSFDFFFNFEGFQAFFQAIADFFQAFFLSISFGF